MRNSVRTLQQVLEEPFRGGPVALCLYQDVNNLTVLIDCSPQVVSRSIHADKDLVDMPASA
jgi:TPP-dependent trihydroxycyclohexane-1,2-dione (THcHDO) dehydratase